MRTIPLTRGFCAIVDDEHYNYLNQWKWHYQDGCAARMAPWSLNGKWRYRKIYMHREVAGITGFLVDHVNHNRLDNRSANLRVATQSENSMNQRKQIRSKSTYKGVCRDGNSFHARIQKDGVRLPLGYFKTELEAGLAYNKAAAELFGDRACLNDVGGRTA